MGISVRKFWGAYFSVYNSLGFGFLERVYENAMILELEAVGIVYERQKPIDVYYRGWVVGKYFADILVEGKIVVELKAAETLHPEHERQLINYLKATDLEVGLLLNFGTKPQFIRKVFANTKNPL